MNVLPLFLMLPLQFQPVGLIFIRECSMNVRCPITYAGNIDTQQIMRTFGLNKPRFSGRYYE